MTRAEEQVRQCLRAIEDIDGGWEALLHLVWVRSVVTRLGHVRECRGILLEEVAHPSGISPSAIAEFEKQNLPEVPISTLTAWADALAQLVPGAGGATTLAEAYAEGFDAAAEEAGECCGCNILLEANPYAERVSV